MPFSLIPHGNFRTILLLSIPTFAAQEYLITTVWSTICQQHRLKGLLTAIVTWYSCDFKRKRHITFEQTLGNGNIGLLRAARSCLTVNRNDSLCDCCRFVQRVVHNRTVRLPSHTDITCSHMHCHGNTEECEETTEVTVIRANWT